MTATDPATSAAPVAPWTCPFCPLLCDRFSAAPDADGHWALVGSDCGRAREALARFEVSPPATRPQVDGRACDLATAVAAAAALLAASRQPLFAGLGIDAAGARALYPLAARSGAICDAAGGEALHLGLAALQDRGAFTTTLGEVRNRADLLLFIGEPPVARYPELLRRCGVGAADGPVAVALGTRGDAQAAGDDPSARVTDDANDAAGIERFEVDADLFDAVALLAAGVAGRALGVAAPAAAAVLAPLASLAQRLHAARYAVVVYEPARLPAHGALIVEAIGRLVATLNRRTRAAALPLGGADGGATVNAVVTWLSGLPLRSRAGPAGLEHEPLRFGAQRLLAGGAVDALLWIASFGTEPVAPPGDVPRVVLGHPRFAPNAGAAAPAVFIPVATPGIDTPGHLFRTDGSVLMPLHALRETTLPSVADVLQRIAQAWPEVAS